MDLGVVGIFMIMEVWEEGGVVYISCVDGVKKKERGWKIV